MKSNVTIDWGYKFISMIGRFTKREDLQEWNDFKSSICNYLHTLINLIYTQQNIKSINNALFHIIIGFYFNNDIEY